MVIERSCDVTPRSKFEKSKGHSRSPCALNLVQFRPLFPELRHFDKLARAISLWSTAILKVSVEPNQFPNLTYSPEWEKTDLRISGRFGHVCMQPLCQGKSQRLQRANNSSYSFNADRVIEQSVQKGLERKNWEFEFRVWVVV